MTRAELAKDKLKYWNLIDRARRVNFTIPSHWLKYGEPPFSAAEIVNVVMDSVFTQERIENMFNMTSPFYNMLKRKLK